MNALGFDAQDVTNLKVTTEISSEKSSPERLL
jgi:hypothetical protein